MVTRHDTILHWLVLKQISVKICYHKHSITYRELAASTKKSEVYDRNKKRNVSHSRSVKKKNDCVKRRNDTRTKNKC